MCSRFENENSLASPKFSESTNIAFMEALLITLVRMEGTIDKANHLPEPTLASGTAPAGQDPRHR
jgi:hypothetical protein